MKRFIKYSLYTLTYLIIIFFLAIMFIVTAKADLVKPNTDIDPDQVVKIQLSGLMNNDLPIKDNGIKQTWEFAHPLNKKYMVGYGYILLRLNDKLKGYEYIDKVEGVIKFTPTYYKII